MDSELIAAIKEISTALTEIKAQMEKQTEVLTTISHGLEDISEGVTR